MPRRTLWFDTLLEHDITVASALLLDLISQASETEARLAGMTLLRTIIVLTLAYTVHDAGEGSQNVFMGLGIAQQEQFVAGVGSLPKPDTTGDFPQRGWIYRAGWRIFGFAADQPAVDVVRIDKDIRSQRKLDNGVLYVRFQQTLNEGAASVVNVTGIIRQLWLLT